MWGTSQSSPPPSDDPLDQVLKPPPDETPEQAALRIQREDEARQISLAIDASIKAERQARKKKRIVRLLLLGQSESGKSTTLRQFQRLYTPTAFREERILWRAVIQLNIVRSIRIILDAISLPTSPLMSPSTSPHPHKRKLSHNRERRISNSFASNGDPGPSSPRGSNGHAFSSYYRADSGNESDGESDSEFHAGRSDHSSVAFYSSPWESLKMRLLPLKHIEALLIAKLVPPNEDEATQLAGPSHSARQGAQPPLAYRTHEVFVRPGAGWKGALSKARHIPSASLGGDEKTSRPTSAGNAGLETPDEPQEVLHQCRRDIIALWNDEGVRAILAHRKIRLEEFPGFFLNDLERVTSLKYLPTDDDVLKARLKTVGVCEYKFEMEVSTGRETPTEWRIIDSAISIYLFLIVIPSATRYQESWVPFFDDVDAIIFLAPISGFDQVLAEDRTINRLEDSVLLWKSVCSNKLLANVDLVLFLNKCDILEQKLSSGVRLAKYVRSYGDRPNDMENVSKYLRSKFSAIHREYSPNPRKFYAFCTSVTDTATTAGIIASVRDMVIRQHLKQSKLLS
uniref:Guanine nucleotide-binding protein alpha-4 subunit n=1 Tax=Moniliophthora roreri TaxID=221103 RepID=A0A0W0EZX8_MONRR